VTGEENVLMKVQVADTDELTEVVDRFFLCDPNSVPRGNGAAPICSPHRQQARAAFEVRTGFGGRALVGAASMLARASCTPAVPLTLEMVHQDGTSYRVALRSNYARYRMMRLHHCSMWQRGWGAESGDIAICIEAPRA
jgi:hypothetical protein